jgi:predicted ATP-binding protein involved in virulence
MQINTLQLLNFRCFEDLTLHFNPHFNVLIGDNMAGKTSVLDALGAFLKWPVSFLKVGSIADGTEKVLSKNTSAEDVENHNKKYFYKDITDDDIRQINIGEYREKVIQEVVINVNNTEYIRYYLREGKSHYNSRSEDPTFFILLKSYFNEQKIENFPVYVYYPVNNRGGGIKPEKIELTATTEISSRFDAYQYCFNPYNIENIEKVDEWYKTKQITKEKNGNAKKIAVIENALRNCIPMCENVFFDIEEGQFMMEMQDGKAVAFRHLSTGMQGILMMVRDLAYRCVYLNGHLGENATLETEGLVLIDELDAHLHPSWQQTIVGGLKKTFPKIQFFVTAHSPHIIASAGAGEVIDMNNAVEASEIYAEQQSFQGWQLQYILEELMSVNFENSPNYETQILPLRKELQIAYEDRNVLVYINILEKLKPLLPENDPSIILYEMKLRDLQKTAL